MAYKYSKLGYGNAKDVEAAIALGLIDGKDLIITKDTSEFIYVRDDLSIQKVAPRTLCFDSIPAANEAINQNDATYVSRSSKQTKSIYKNRKSSGLLHPELSRHTYTKIGRHKFAR